MNGTRKCSVVGCDRKFYGRGLCNLHYTRSRKAGLLPVVTQTESERFWRRVIKASGCWEWRGCHIPDGYGTFWVQPRMVLAHRYSYEATYGPIPENLELDHLCRNRGCVRPDHLEAVTHKENTRRAVNLFGKNN